MKVHIGTSYEVETEFLGLMCTEYETEVYIKRPGEKRLKVGSVFVKPATWVYETKVSACTPVGVTTGSWVEVFSDCTHRGSKQNSVAKLKREAVAKLVEFYHNNQHLKWR